MPMLPFPEYAPDVSAYQVGSTQFIQNVHARKDGYGPALSPSIYSQALSGPCRGYFYARNNDGSVTIFAATATNLYRMNNTDFSWTNVSLGGGPYAAIPSGDQWGFVQFNNLVIATQINVAPQVYDLTAAVPFANLGGSPPQARYVAVVGRFVVLSGLGSTTPYRIQWSGLNAVTTWISGVLQSDFQDFPDGGIVRSVAGSEFSAIVFQDSALRRMTYVGGTLIFQFERIALDHGIFAPLSIVRGGDRIFYSGNDGFQMIEPGGLPQQIGKERVDRTFFANVDKSALQYVIGANDPQTTRVYWSWKSLAGMAGQFDKVLVYDYAINRWSLVAGWGGEYMATLARPGLTLENLDSISGSIDALTFSLDDVATGALAAPSIFDTSHRLNFLTGPPLEATLDSDEHEMDGARRVRVQGFRPDTDAPACYGSIGARENMQSLPVYSDEQAVNAKGLCPMNVSTRLARGRIRIPAATAWTVAQGIEPFFAQEGKR